MTHCIYNRPNLISWVVLQRKANLTLAFLVRLKSNGHWG